ncbi:MAG: carboxypeptidase regulatory-like domain-containing protein [Roseiflexaceae bacterium]|nr:carboxypeptidase regulatory-like domain-containing protein [Roseiflexaceae bacterium]
MNRYHKVVVGLFVAASFLFSTPATARPARLTPATSVVAAIPTCASGGTGTATISGTVRGTKIGPSSGIQNATVELYNASGTFVTAVSTIAAGAYSIPNLVGGTYLIRFNPQYAAGGLLDEWYDGKPDQASATPVTLAEGGMLSGINATLVPGARISGRVTAADTAAPLQSVDVQIYDTTGQRVASAYTDATGNYITSPGLRTGNYKVYFPSPIGKPYLAEYYADKADLASAETVAVTAPATRSGVDAALAPAARISGRVTDAASGVGLANMQVTISGDDGYIDSDYTDASGDYSTTAGLASGSYELKFGPSSDTSDYITQGKTVTLSAPDLLPNVNAALEKGGRITGRVTDGAGTPLQNITVFVGDVTNGRYQNYVYTNAAGIYTAYALPTDNYIVHFRPNEYVEEYYNDKPDRQLADRIAVTAPNTTSGIDAVLARGGAVSGRVTDATTGTGLDDVSVQIYDASGDRVETVNTDATGQYATKPVLRAGEYRVKFIPDDNGSACGYASEFYNTKASFDTADTIAIAPPNSATNIDAALDLGSSISGRVSALGSAGVGSVYVRVYDSAGKAVAEGRTNTAGSYITTPALPSGTYRVGFSPRSDNPQRYLGEFYSDKATLALSDPIVITAPTAVTNTDAVLAQGGAISGRITAADTGLPLVNVAVSILNAAGDSVAYAYTTSDGVYTTSGLPSGSYRVSFDPQGDSRPYAGAFYAGVVAVTAPNITANIDAALPRGATIAGRVTDANTGVPLPNIDVLIYDSSGEYIAWAETGPDGSYVTEDSIGPGTYRVGFNPYGDPSGYAAAFSNGKTSLATADSIMVSGTTNVTGIDAALVKGGLISGKVTDASSGAGLSRIEIEVYDSSGNQVAAGYTGPTGLYVTEPALVSGSYRVRFAPSDYGEMGGYIATFANGKNTLASADAVEVAAPATRSGVDAVLAKGAQITGQVFAMGVTQSAVGTVGQPGATVTVYDSAGQPVAAGETNGLGVYQTRPGLPNGAYRLRFTPPAGSGYGPTFYSGKLSLAAADPLTISAPGMRSGIDDTLLPARSVFLPVTVR